MRDGFCGFVLNFGAEGFELFLQFGGFESDFLAGKNVPEDPFALPADDSELEQFLKGKVSGLVGAVVRQDVEVVVEAFGGAAPIAFAGQPSGAFVALPIFEGVLELPEIVFASGFLVLLDGNVHGL